MKTPSRQLRCERGSTAAEFALVLPLLVILLFGIIDAGRFLWDLNKAEKATQAGVRFAAVTNMVPSSLAAYKFTTGTEVGSVSPGVPVPTSSFGSVTCDQTACTNSGTGPAPGFDAVAFNAIGDRMRTIEPTISNSNFTITYRNVGLGYAGDPFGSDVEPEITIALQGMTFTPITSLLFASLTMPAASSSMTMEDGIGSVSN
jgi:hypothetical protein